MKPLLLILLALVIAAGPVRVAAELSDDQVYYQTKNAQMAELLYKGGFLSTTIGLLLSIPWDATYVPAGITVTGNIMYVAGWASLVGGTCWQRSIAWLVTGKEVEMPKYTWLSFTGGFLFLGSALALQAHDQPGWALTAAAGGLACHVYSYLKFSDTKNRANQRIWDRALGK
jgi:hypothetical protein